jgi:hypothetical protein
LLLLLLLFMLLLLLLVPMLVLLLVLQVGIIGDASVTVGVAVTELLLLRDCHGQLRDFMGASWIPNRFQAALLTRPKAIESTGVLLFKVTIQN